MLVVHLTTRLRDRWRTLLEGDHARWLWKHLRRAFPMALAVSLMPNHVHVVAVVRSIEGARASFVKVLAAFARRLPWTRPVWEPVPTPKQLHGSDKILRDVRYVALNAPCAGLVKDPLAWYWSTHHDVLGAIDDPWVTFDRLRPHLPAYFKDVQRLHGYVSAHPKTCVTGTPMPIAAPDTMIPTQPLAAVALASMVSTRGSIEDLRARGTTRATFVRLAAAQGWNDTALLARVCRVTPDSIARLLRAPPPTGLVHARLCLGDHRLLQSVGAPTTEQLIELEPS